MVDNPTKFSRRVRAAHDDGRQGVWKILEDGPEPFDLLSRRAFAIARRSQVPHIPTAILFTLNGMDWQDGRLSYHADGCP